MKNKLWTIHHDVRVYWDEDYDERILARLDQVIPLIEILFGYNPVIAVTEHEGSLSVLVDILWGKGITAIVQDVFEHDSTNVDGDSWSTSVYAAAGFGYRSHEVPRDVINTYSPQYDEIVRNYGSIKAWLSARSEIQKSKESALRREAKLMQRIVDLQNEIARQNER